MEYHYVNKIGATVISTVNAFDHGWETAVFPNGIDGRGSYVMERYGSHKEALTGHRVYVRSWPTA